MTITIVHLVRHGEVHNPEQVLYGRIPDYHLSQLGRRQAAATAQSFTGHDVRALYASPLERAQETARPFAKLLDLEVRADEDLIEAGNQFEGLRVKGWNSELWNPKYWPLMINPTEPSWGEPYDDIAERMMAAVHRARREVEGGEAILVSHQLPIVCVQRLVNNKPLYHNPGSRQCNLASVSSLVFDDDQIIEYRYSEPSRGVC